MISQILKSNEICNIKFENKIDQNEIYFGISILNHEKIPKIIINLYNLLKSLILNYTTNDIFLFIEEMTKIKQEELQIKIF